MHALVQLGVLDLVEHVGLGAFGVLDLAALPTAVHLVASLRLQLKLCFDFVSLLLLKFLLLGLGGGLLLLQLLFLLLA